MDQEMLNRWRIIKLMFASIDQLVVPFALKGNRRNGPLSRTRLRRLRDACHELAKMTFAHEQRLSAEERRRRKVAK